MPLFKLTCVFVKDCLIVCKSHSDGRPQWFWCVAASYKVDIVILCSPCKALKEI